MSSFDTDHISVSPRLSAESSDQQPSSSGNSKKKFGKNLNKLTKPPPPPPNALSSGSRRDASGKGSNTQGLLLLSTKRGSSSVAGGVSASPSSNLLSKLSGGTAATSSALRSFNTPSLKSLGGSSSGGFESGSTTTTTGWKTTPAVSTPAMPVAEVANSSSVPWSLGVEKSVTDFPSVSATFENDQMQNVAAKNTSQNGLGGENLMDDAPSKSRQNESSKGDLDSLRPAERPSEIFTKENQEAYFDIPTGTEGNANHESKVPKEPLKDTAGDEEPRISTAERIRAQRRLKTLEEKLPVSSSVSLSKQSDASPSSSRPGKKSTSSTPHPSTVPTPILVLSGGRSNGAKNNEVSIILEPLNRPKIGDGSKMGGGNTDVDSKNPPRIKSSTEIAENDVGSRSYSSLLGGSSTARNQVAGAVSDQQKLQYASKEVPGSSSANTKQLYNPYSGQDQESAKPVGMVDLPPVQSATDASAVAVIHLSSYDDQDRGERNRASSGPRMLFDPKSGSMVEARPRENRKVKDKPHEEKNETKSSRDRTSNDREKEKQSVQTKPGKSTSIPTQKRSDLTSEPVGDQSSVNETDRKSSAKKQQRKEASRKQPSGSLESKKANNNTSSSSSKKGANNPNSDRLARGVGDSSKKADSAAVRESEECATGGDKIAAESTKYQEKQVSRQPNGFAEKLSGGKGLKKLPGKRGEHIAMRQPERIDAKSQRKNDAQRKDRRLVGGRKGPVNESVKILVDASANAPKVEFEDDFNFDDDLLLEDDPDSPTLKATADAWRPSEAALRAAAAAAKSGNGAPTDVGVTKKNEADDEDSESDIPFFGLGFDPTLDMDAVMMSPSLRSEVTDDEPLGLNSLSLGPTTKPSITPFSAISSPNQFLGSGTWGGGSLHANAASLGLDWNSLLGAAQSESKSSSEKAVSNAGMTKSSSNSFLSLSPLPSNADGKREVWAREILEGSKIPSDFCSGRICQS
mmetsp:Transcript_21829/g.31311  ORF Transcript_21829/g.31311 Transcript_21829/m.31311 type:complete len:971 (+) Transcript_21829:302-3214(+)